MADFRYKAMTTTGAIIRGRIAASSEAAVISHLRNEGHYPISASRGRRCRLHQRFAAAIAIRQFRFAPPVERHHPRAFRPSPRRTGTRPGSRRDHQSARRQRPASKPCGRASPCARWLHAGRCARRRAGFPEILCQHGARGRVGRHPRADAAQTFGLSDENTCHPGSCPFRAGLSHHPHGHGGAFDHLYSHIRPSVIRAACSQALAGSCLCRRRSRWASATRFAAIGGLPFCCR